MGEVDSEAVSAGTPSRLFSNVRNASLSQRERAGARENSLDSIHATALAKSR
jgi:hypothetical protein